MSKKLTYEAILPVIQSSVERISERISDETKYENATESNFQKEEVAHKAVSGFMPFTNGGFSIKWFDHVDWFLSTGYRLPTNTLQAKIEDYQVQAYENAKDNLIENYPEIVEELGEDNIDYNSLYDAGYESEAEELSSDEMEYNQDETVMFEVGAYYYNPSNSRSKDAEHTINLFGLVNLESPYHRQGNNEDFVEVEFTFSSIEELEELFAKYEDKIVSWFQGGNFKEGRELAIVRMKKGGDIKADKRLKALHAGKRESANGNTYYEYRQNRSDVNRTKRFDNGGDVKDGKNGYIAFYKGKQMEVYGDTSLQARNKASKAFKAKKEYDVTVVLAEKEDKQVTHVTNFKDGGSVGEIKDLMYKAFQSWLDEKSTDEALVYKLHKILGKRRWFRFFKGDTLASDYNSVKSSMSSSKNNRDFLKENMKISIEERGLQIYNYEGNEIYAKGGSITSTSKFNDDTNTWFDGLVSLSKDMEGHEKMTKLIAITNKVATKANLEKFKEILMECECPKPELKKAIIAQLDKVIDGKYKSEFRFTFGGNRGGGKTSSASEFLSMFNQAATYGKFADGGEVEKIEIKDKIETILNKVLPKFQHSVTVYKSYFGNGKNLAIKISASPKEINNVRGQNPQAVSLTLDLQTLELHPQIFGGNGGQSIYRNPNMDDPKEKYLAMKNVKVPFRTPPKDEASVLKAIERFTENYKKTLKENIDVLRYKDIVDYNDLLKDVYVDGGELNYVHTGRYLDLDTMPNGNLRISINEDGKEEVADLRKDDNRTDEQIMYDLFDDIQGNSELMFFGDAGESGFGLTSAPAITDGYFYDDDSELTDEGHEDSAVYYYEQYMVKSFIDEMLENGFVIFDKANSFARGGGVKSSNQNARSLVMSKTPFNASNLSGEFVGDTYVVKSYGYYPLFVYKDGTWYENKDKYSVSTSKQTSQARPTDDTKKISTDDMKDLYGFENGGSVGKSSIENSIKNKLSSNQKISLEDVKAYLGRKPEYEENILGYEIRKCLFEQSFKKID